jgi:predicted hotdog family 3-hydroxylacyl-ACP dehydratase
MLKSALIEKDELMTLVPHKGKMFLLSRVVSFDVDKRSLVSEYDINGGCLFFDHKLGGVPAWVGFEFMAQSISALSGIQGRLRGEAPKFGFILSVSGLEITMPVFKDGSTAITTVEEETVVESVYSFWCGIDSGGKRAVRAKLTVMEAEHPESVLNRDG